MLFLSQKKLLILISWPSFYEAVGCQAPCDSSTVRASSRRSGLLPSREAAEAAPITSTSFGSYVSLPVSHWPVRGKSGIGPTTFYPW